MKRSIVACAWAVTVCSNVWAENAVRAGRFVVEPPPLICLGFEWEIAGDDNRNATVEVNYRPSGQSSWKDGMPLLRMGGERIFSAPIPCRTGSRGASSTSSRPPSTRCG